VGVLVLVTVAAIVAVEPVAVGVGVLVAVPVGVCVLVNVFVGVWVFDIDSVFVGLGVMQSLIAKASGSLFLSCDAAIFFTCLLLQFISIGCIAPGCKFDIVVLQPETARIIMFIFVLSARAEGNVVTT
jgi:hypothetical protein